MSVLARIFGFGGWDMSPIKAVNLEHVYHQKEQKSLQRVLEFTGHTIDDVINDRIVRERVKYYFRRYKEVERELAEADRLKREKERAGQWLYGKT